MPFNETLAGRVRQVLGNVPDVVEKRMFGGLAFMVGGHMCCGIVGEDLMLRVGAERYEEALEDHAARPMDFTGRPMRGMVYVSPAGTKNDEELADWVGRAIEFVETLPPK